MRAVKPAIGLAIEQPLGADGLHSRRRSIAPSPIFSRSLWPIWCAARNRRFHFLLRGVRAESRGSRRNVLDEALGFRGTRFIAPRRPVARSDHPPLIAGKKCTSLFALTG